MHTESCPSSKLSPDLDASSAPNNSSALEDDLALSSSTLGPLEKSLPDKVVYVNEDTMDCSYSECAGTPRSDAKLRPDVSSPEMFESDEDDCDETDHPELPSGCGKGTAPRSEKAEEKLSVEESVARSDVYALARMNKFLAGVPPPPKHTICQSDCNDLLSRIRQNRSYFLVDPLVSGDGIDANVGTMTKQTFESVVKNCTNGRSFNHRAKSSLRNLTNAFDACDRSNESTTSAREESSRSVNADGEMRTSEGLRSDERVVDKSSDDARDEGIFMDHGQSNMSDSQTMSVASFNEFNGYRDNVKHVTFAMPQDEVRRPVCMTINVEEAKNLDFSIAYNHKTHGIHYNRSKAVEDFEGLTMKLCHRYIGAETQSSCNIWFTKQAPASAKKRNLLARRVNGQSPGKRLSHLARRRRTFSSANLQGLGMAEKKQLVLNIKKPTMRKGKSPRGKSPRGSAKKRGIRPSPSPRKSSKLETSKRALFQSPPNDRAGPSRGVSLINTNPQRIKRALFSTSITKEESAKPSASIDSMKTGSFEESRKRKNDEELEGPRFKWAKSLSFDCAHSLESNSADSWSSERHSTGGYLMKAGGTVQQGKCELSETHRKKLLWAVAEALRSKGIRLGHPRFKHCASQLARTVKKYMPDLENRNVPRKPGSTSDRMLKLAKHHVLFIVETKSTE